MSTSSNFSTSNEFIKYRIAVTENSYSIANNTSEVNVKVQAWRTNQGYTTDGAGTCYVNIDGTNYSNSWQYQEKPITYNSYTTLFDRTVTIPHNSDGSKTIYVSAYISHARFSSNSQGFNATLSTIPRQANIVSAPDFYDTDNPTITYNNPAGDIPEITSLQACISLNGSQDDISYRDISKTGTSYTFNLNQAERNTLLAACPNSNTLSVTFIIKTVLSGQTYYSTVTKTMTVKNANPTITGSSYADTNATTTAITQNNQQIIQLNSTVSFNFTSLAAVKYATLVKVEITSNAVTVSSSLSGSSVSNHTVAFGTINSTTDIEASIKLTDSRGNITTESLNITMLAWSLPTGIISLSRKSNYYDETYIKVNADYSYLDNKNTISIQYQYKETSSSTWSALASLQDNVQATLSLDNTKSYDFKIFVADSIGLTTYNAVLQIGIPILFIDKLKRSVGIGTIPDQPNQLAVDRRIELKNTLQESLVDLWTTILTDNYRSAALFFRNHTGAEVLRLGGDTTNGQGYVRVNNANGNNIVALGRSNYGGGTAIIRDSSGNDRGRFFHGPYGGTLNLYNEDNNLALSVWVGGNKDGVVDVYDSNGTATITLIGQTGAITCVSLTQTSSRKLKENIKPMPIDEARKILLLNAVSFDFKDKAKGTDKRGFIAEDVAEVIPELVTPETEEAPAKLDYIQMIPYLVETIKNQERRIQDLEAKVEELSKKLT